MWGWFCGCNGGVGPVRMGKITSEYEIWYFFDYFYNPVSAIKLCCQSRWETKTIVSNFKLKWHQLWSMIYANFNLFIYLISSLFYFCFIQLISLQLTYFFFFNINHFHLRTCSRRSFFAIKWCVYVIKSINFMHFKYLPHSADCYSLPDCCLLIVESMFAFPTLSPQLFAHNFVK